MKLVERVLLLRDFRAQTLRLRGLLYDVLGPAGCDTLLIAYEGRMSGDVRLELLALALSPHASPDQLPHACTRPCMAHSSYHGIRKRVHPAKYPPTVLPAKPRPSC